MSRVGLRSRSEAAINRAAGVKVAKDEKAAAKKSRLVAKSGNLKGAALVKFGFEADATLPQVIEILKSELTEIQHATSERMKAWAERAAVLVEVFQLKQEQAAAKLGRSQPWVSAILKWRRDGYKQTAFGPQANQARLLVATNKPSPPQLPASDTVVRGADGKPLDTSGFVGPAKLQLAAELAKAAAEPGGRRNGVYVKSHDPKRTANMTRITKAIHKAEASGDAAALAVAVAEREAAEMIFRETFTKGSETFTVTSLNYENDFSDKATNGCLTREEIAENERAHGVGFGGVTMSKYPAEPEAVEVQTESLEEISSRPEPPRVLSAEEKSDDALTAFKVACQTHCPVMSDADLKAARLYVQGKDGNGQGTWRPRNATIKKAA